jgi:hypothetical protein
MRRPKWLSGWGKGKNCFEGSLIIDAPDIKVVEASFNKNLAFIAIGTTKKRETAFPGEGVVEKYGTRKDLEWKIFYDPTALPEFIPVDKAKDFMAGAVAVSSGSASAYDVGTAYVASGIRPSKGNAPLLLDYEMAKKIEEAKKRKDEVNSPRAFHICKSGHDQKYHDNNRGQDIQVCRCWL